MKLYGVQANGRTGKVQVVAGLAGLHVEFVPTTVESAANKDFKKKNPLQKLPVLETPEGHIYESNAILRYLARIGANKTLYGSNPYEAGLVDQWLDFSQNELEVNTLAQALQVFGYVPADPQAFKSFGEVNTFNLSVLEEQLKKSKFVTGEHVTIADISLASVVRVLFTYILGDEQRKHFPRVTEWFTTIANLKDWKDFFGRARLAKVPFGLPIEQKAKKEEKQKEEKQEKPKEEKPKQEQKPKAEPKPKAEQKPKEEKPKAQPKQNEDDDDGEKQQEKKKNPLDLLPASTFNIDDYKRQYFLDKDIKNQINVLFQQIDAQGWSLWEIIYNKAENEGKMLLITNNMKRGFLQRMDPHFRKYAFGVHGVYGEEPDLQIRGAWLWRGLEIPQEILDHPSYEYHTFNRIDLGNEEQKQRWANYWIFQEEDQVTNGLRTRDVEYYR